MAGDQPQAPPPLRDALRVIDTRSHPPPGRRTTPGSRLTSHDLRLITI